MVLIKSSEIRLPVSSKSKTKELMIPSALIETEADPQPDLVEFSPGVITRSIGLLEHGRQKHYYSDGNFNLIRLMFTSSIIGALPSVLRQSLL
jgi:hypothetical protein